MRNGKWSRKSLTILVSFTSMLWVGLYIVYGNEVNDGAMIVFQTLAVMVSGLLGLSVIDKKVNDDGGDA